MSTAGSLTPPLSVIVKIVEVKSRSKRIPYVMFHVRNLENGDARGKMLQITVGLVSSIIFENGRFLEWSIVLARRPVLWVMR